MSVFVTIIVSDDSVDVNEMTIPVKQIKGVYKVNKDRILKKPLCWVTRGKQRYIVSVDEYERLKQVLSGTNYVLGHNPPSNYGQGLRYANIPEGEL